MVSIINKLNELSSEIDIVVTSDKLNVSFNNCYDLVGQNYINIKQCYENNEKIKNIDYMNNCNKLLSSLNYGVNNKLLRDLCKKLRSYLWYLDIYMIDDTQFIDENGLLKENNEYNQYSNDFFWVQGHSTRYHSFKNLLHLQFMYRTQYDEICELFGKDNMQTNGYKHKYIYKDHVYKIKVIDGTIHIKCYYNC